MLLFLAGEFACQAPQLAVLRLSCDRAVVLHAAHLVAARVFQRVVGLHEVVEAVLPAHFGRGRLAGKARCKAALQAELGLPVRPEVPLAVLVGRLAEQKGIDLVLASLPELLRADVQVALLGTGRQDYERALERLSREHPDRMLARAHFDEGLAHRMEAGADLFLMPSLFEPCGLNQMYSLRYGTVPVVRAVGGLADTVEDFDGKDRGTGFAFGEYSPRAFLTAVRRALDVFRDAAAWRGIQDRGMAQDNSWGQRAERYETLYWELAGEASRRW